MTASRVTACCAMVVLFAGFLAVTLRTTPWTPLPGPIPGGRVPDAISTDFTAGQIAQLHAYRSAVHPPAYLSYALTVLLPLVLGFTPWGGRLVRAVAAPLGGGWAWRVALGGAVLVALLRVCALPFDAWSQQVQKHYGISHQDWPSWLIDQLRGLGLALAVAVPVLLLAFLLVRRAPQWWWAGAAALVAALVLGISFAYPVVIEPMSNHFTTLTQEPLRDELLALAAHDHIRVSDILVADASRRTTAENAYVSGFGATRRIVVYDTLLKESDTDVRLVVAHELGHAKNNDVLHGTIEGALGAAGAVCLLYLLVSWPWLQRRAGVSGLADGRAVALALALVALLTFVSTPVQNLISRRIEARADVHSLDLTRDPLDFVRAQIQLTLTNLSGLQPNPLQFALFSTHPSTPERIGTARDWAKKYGVPVPPPQAGTG